MSDPRRVMMQLTAPTARLPRKSQPSRPVFTAPGTDEQLSTAVAVYPQIDMSGSSTVSIANHDRTRLVIVPQLKIVRDTGAPWLDLPLSESAGPRS